MCEHTQTRSETLEVLSPHAVKHWEMGDMALQLLNDKVTFWLETISSSGMENYFLSNCLSKKIIWFTACVTLISKLNKLPLNHYLYNIGTLKAEDKARWLVYIAIRHVYFTKWQVYFITILYV